MPEVVPIVLLTRPIVAAKRFAAQLEGEGRHRVIFSPLLHIEKTATQPEFEAAILTSENGIPDGLVGKGRRAYCVGERTSIAARKAGFVTPLVAACADDLVAQMIKAPPVEPLTHLRGEFARGDIAERLCQAGMNCTEIITYRQIEQVFSKEAVSCFQARNTIILPLFSPRTAILAQDQILKIPNICADIDLTIIALSGAVADSLHGKFSRAVVEAPLPTGNAMQQIVASYLR